MERDGDIALWENSSMALLSVKIVVSNVSLTEHANSKVDSKQTAIELQVHMMICHFVAEGSVHLRSKLG